MPKRVIVASFETNATVYQAFSELKKMQTERKIHGEQMAVVSPPNTGNSQFEIVDFIDFNETNHSGF